MNHSQLFYFNICHKFYTFELTFESVRIKMYQKNREREIETEKKIQCTEKRRQCSSFCPTKLIRPISPEHSCAAEVTLLQRLRGVWK